MANPPRTRKRIHAVANAVRRGPDGSAFEKCPSCDILVAIALADMHDCRSKSVVKRFKRGFEFHNPKKQRSLGEPRSPFSLFIEIFKNTWKTGNSIDVDRKGFETWKNMSMEERGTYIIQAEKVNSAYLKILLKEEEDRIEVDDEADSAMVGKFGEFYGYYEDFEDSDSFKSFLGSKTTSLDTLEWNKLFPLKMDIKDI